MGLFSIAVILMLVLAVIIWIIRLKNKNKEYFEKLSGPTPQLIFGNMLLVNKTTEILNALLEQKQKFGGLYKVQLGPFYKAVIAADYKFLECVLASTKILNKSDDYLYLRQWLGTGLLTSEGPKWKKHRKILTPAFHFKILEQFVEVFESEGKKLIQKLQNQVGQDDVDIYQFITLCTLDIICESAMGTSINAQSNDDSDYVRSVKAMCKTIMERLFNILELSDFTYPLTKNYYLQKKSLKILHRHTNSVITERRNELQRNAVIGISEETLGNDHEIYGNKRRMAFLDLLLNATVDGRPLTQEEIREEVDTFMFEYITSEMGDVSLHPSVYVYDTARGCDETSTAGHDTTASAISFALYSLANNPDVQKKAFEEQVALFGGIKNPRISHADLQNMKYLELVIKETLRLYPSVPFYARKTTEPVEYDGTVLPKDLTIMIFAYGIHRDPTYFEDPEKFNPGRFETIDGKFPYAYIPFSAGPRNCIGQKFAMLEMKSTISKIIRNFELQPAKPFHELKLAAETVLKSVNGVRVGIKSRNYV